MRSNVVSNPRMTTTKKATQATRHENKGAGLATVPRSYAIDNSKVLQPRMFSESPVTATIDPNQFT
jgi:hypothetical protein